ncbi:MAG: DNA cytosine methyltransferase [Verrucomicrobia bacterium]|jgi:DNA (cytosine-5)-methyltransferase 1|nr:DNA cytosine methyltransferase [Verrucomicrobiota bacterium]
MSSSSKVTAIDLFCGAGGLTLAAERIGIRVVGALDNDSNACRTYRRNFIGKRTNAPILVEKDILKIHAAGFLRLVKMRPGDLDILMGGPPCQGYSIHRLKDSGVKDPRNALLVRYIEFVRVIQPKAFVIENVPGLLRERHSAYLHRLYRLAEEAGYELAPPVTLNAVDYGVPQNRKRVFILGTRGYAGDAQWPPLPTHFDPSSAFATESGLAAWRTASDVFKQAMRAGDPNNVHMHHSPELVRVFASTPRNGGSRRHSNRTLECHTEHDGHWDVYGRINPAKPGPTMTTACVNPSKGRFLHPTKNHGITVRHAARFQTFPDDFVFEGGLMSGATQVGNAVPVLLGAAVLKSVLAFVRAGAKP